MKWRHLINFSLPVREDQRNCQQDQLVRIQARSLKNFVQTTGIQVNSLQQLFIFFFASFYVLLVKNNFKMIWNISDLSRRDWIWERITSKYIRAVVNVQGYMIVLYLFSYFLFQGNKRSRGKRGRTLRRTGQTMTRWKLFTKSDSRESLNFQVPTRETLMRQSELLVNAKQGPKKGGRRKI